MLSIGKEYLETTIRRLKNYKDLADKTFEQLEEKEFNYQPEEESNSIAIIIRHMAGNMLSRWTNFLSEDGEKTWRHRDQEFERKEHSKEQLLEIWEQGWKCFLDTLNSLSEEDLLKTIRIRGEEMTALDAISRQLAHYPYHIGQIVYIGKMLRGKDWKNLSIPKGHSQSYNISKGLTDPVKKN